ncbi:MAG: helix-turn-helix transcriptional regulator [Spirochaetaceae bacterium]|nr:helix-turn-helix transcriptional regulator [Spirochaetaceae bacterium]
MPVAEKARRTKNSRKLISVSSKDASEILAYAKKKDPKAHIVTEAPHFEGSILPKNSKWYRDVKNSWHPGVTLRIRRENAGLTQAQLAAMTDLATSNISAYENGHRSMGLAVAKRLAEALKRPVSEFVEPESTKA